MTPVVSIVDYGAGNLYSVKRAFESVGATVKLVDEPAQIRTAQFLVLPGVGAFADGMNGLRARGLVDPLREYATTQRMFLGICLGMHMMLDTSHEYGAHEGIGIIPGRVIALPNLTTDGRPQKIPHVGWSALREPMQRLSWGQTMLHGLPPGASVYFAHSFGAMPTDPAHRLADCVYGGHLVSAAIRSGWLYGCQFHPEKSGPVGQRILQNFLKTPHA